MNVTHRPLNAVPDGIARAWGGVAIRAQIARGGVVSYWDEVRWDGKPGERSIWIVKPNGRESPQVVNHVILKGTTPLTLYQPYAVACGKNRVPVMQLGIPLIAFQESRGDVWDKYVAKSLDLSHGIGAVVGVNNDAVLPSLVYIIVEQGPAPTTFEVVITWGNSNAQGPAGGFQNSRQLLAACASARSPAPWCCSLAPSCRPRPGPSSALRLRSRRACRPRIGRGSKTCWRRRRFRRASKSSRTPCGSTCSTTCSTTRSSPPR